MYTDLQIDFIRAFGDKELKEGCIIKVEIFGIVEYHTCIGMRKMTDGKGTYQYDKFDMDGVPMEILGSEPHLFPDVAKKLKEKGYLMQIAGLLGSGDTINSYILINSHKLFTGETQEIPFDPCLPLLEQPQAMEQLLSLIK